MENKTLEYPSVIVRGWGDEPVKLALHRLDSKRHRAYVGSMTAQRPIGLPVDQVFVFDDRVGFAQQSLPPQPLLGSRKVFCADRHERRERGRRA